MERMEVRKVKTEWLNYKTGNVSFIDMDGILSEDSWNLPKYHRECEDGKTTARVGEGKVATVLT